MPRSVLPLIVANEVCFLLFYALYKCDQECGYPACTRTETHNPACGCGCGNALPLMPWDTAGPRRWPSDVSLPTQKLIETCISMMRLLSVGICEVNPQRKQCEKM